MIGFDALPIIVTVVITAGVMILGILIGISVHREATRRRRTRLHLQEMELALEWAALDGQRRFDQRMVA